MIFRVKVGSDRLWWFRCDRFCPKTKKPGFCGGYV